MGSRSCHFCVLAILIHPRSSLYAHFCPPSAVLLCLETHRPFVLHSVTLHSTAVSHRTACCHPDVMWILRCMHRSSAYAPSAHVAVYRMGLQGITSLHECATVFDRPAPSCPRIFTAPRQGSLQHTAKCEHKVSARSNPVGELVKSTMPPRRTPAKRLLGETSCINPRECAWLGDPSASPLHKRGRMADLDYSIGSFAPLRKGAL